MYGFKLVLKVEGEEDVVMYEPSFQDEFTKNKNILGLVLVLDKFKEINKKHSRDMNFEESMQSLLPQQPKKKQGFFRKLVGIITRV